MTQKYRYRWPAILTVALAIWFVLFMAWTAFAGGIEEAAVYGVDRQLCKLIVPQEWVNEAIVRGSVERNVPLSQGFNLTVDQAVILKRAVEETGRVTEYCYMRQAK